MPRSERVAVRRRSLQRWAAVALIGTLCALTVAAVVGSWRQAAIVHTVARESAHTDAYQEAAYLATVEATLVQALLQESDGEEREAIATAGGRTLAAIRTLQPHDAAQAERNARLVRLQLDLQPAVAQYLAQLDAGDVDGAQETLESRIEPVSGDLVTGLRLAAGNQVREYTALIDQAEHESGLLQWGTMLAFLLGLAVLGLVGWWNRTHRLLVERMAAHDALTGLPNRAAFQARTDRAVSTARSGGAPPTVLLLDLDGFKEVNDNLGHHAGDQLLIEVATRLRGALRTGDTVARLGGDEFAVLLVDADDNAGEATAMRIAEVVGEPFVIDGITLGIEVSIGIAACGPDDDTAGLLRHADIAMYTAKEHRLGHTRFNPGQAHETANRLTILGDLRQALDNAGEIELHYQPKISVRSGAVIGAEALARWRHPVRGLIPPNDFIPVLEGTSLIHRFTAVVIDLALAQVRRWLDDGHPIPVAVNVSTRCLLDRAFPDAVAEALRRAGVPGDLLCIEITENTVMADPDRAIDVLRRIRDLGVSTAIDDFGTGYSSMAYLKILPVDEIKVDRSFVRDMVTDHSNYVLVESAVDLGHNLGLVVVAEGVEDDSTVTALNGLGCDIAQGYHYARPLPAGDFSRFLTERRQTTA
ncbi:MAG TPA: EAL domain-containing protein [Actinoplanes sp.]|nr:EAL domain-containing protein [Actinoplanes sp.]